MLRLRDITPPEASRRAPRIPRDQVRLLWHVDYWDGPRSRILLFRGERSWFQVVAENEEDAPQWYRHFVIVRMSVKQLAEEERWHELFRQHVGVHTDYDESGRERPIGALRPREQWHHFYDAAAQRTRLDLSGTKSWDGLSTDGRKLM